MTEPTPIVTINITFDGSKANVSGTFGVLDNPLLFIRMMGLAMQMIANHNSKKTQLEVLNDR